MFVQVKACGSWINLNINGGACFWWSLLNLGGGNSNIFCFSPRNLGKWSNLTNIFQRGWNHQPVSTSNILPHGTVDHSKSPRGFLVYLFCHCLFETKWLWDLKFGKLHIIWKTLLKVKSHQPQSHRMHVTGIFSYYTCTIKIKPFMSVNASVEMDYGSRDFVVRFFFSTSCGSFLLIQHQKLWLLNLPPPNVRPLRSKLVGGDGGGFKDFYSLLLGEASHSDSYFSHKLKPSTSKGW